MNRTQGTVPCVLAKHPNKYHGAGSQSLPAPCFFLSFFRSGSDEGSFERSFAALGMTRRDKQLFSFMKLSKIFF